MANIEKIKTDLQKQTKGVWVDFALGIELKIARARNPKYTEMVRNLTEHLRIKIRDDSIEIDELNEVLLKVRARTILLDWKNIEDKDGVAIPYSPEKAEEFFRDPELQDFYKFVQIVSDDADQYRKELIEGIEKNS